MESVLRPRDPESANKARDLVHWAHEDPNRSLHEFDPGFLWGIMRSVQEGICPRDIMRSLLDVITVLEREDLDTHSMHAAALVLRLKLEEKKRL